MDSIVPSDTPQDNNHVPKTTFIYALKEPDTGEIRYIGKANNPQERLKQHIAHSSNQTRDTHVGYWLLSLRKRGLKPLLEIIEEVPFAVWEERELYWIEWHLQHGHPLTNTAFSAVGTGMASPEMRAKMSAAQKGRKHSPESVEKTAVAHRGMRRSKEARAKMSAVRKEHGPYPLSEETRRKLGNANRGRKQTPEHITKRAAWKGRKHTPEAKAKMSAAKKGKQHGPMSEEQKQKLSESCRGKEVSDETRAKLSASSRGHRPSPETRAKMSLSQKRRHAIEKNPPDIPTLWD